MKKIRLTVTDIRGADWHEDYDVADDVNENDWAAKTIARFNDTLKPDERARTLKGVEVLAVIGDEELEIEEYWSELKRLGDCYDELVLDKEAWCEPFYDGVSAKDNFFDEFPEHRP